MIRRLAVAFCFFAAAAAATEESQTPHIAPDIAVRELWFQHSERGYALRAKLSAGAPETVRPLLQSGYAVRFKFEMHFVQNRDWLPDRTLGDISWLAEIVYDSLLDRYTFTAGGVTEEYDDLAAALERAGRLRAAPQGGDGLDKIFALPEMYLSARFEMLIDHLPQPLQVSLLTGEWDIDSGWRRFDADVRE